MIVFDAKQLGITIGRLPSTMEIESDDALYMTSNVVSKGSCGTIKKSIHVTSKVVDFSAHMVTKNNLSSLQIYDYHGF